MTSPRQESAILHCFLPRIPWSRIRQPLGPLATRAWIEYGKVSLGLLGAHPKSTTDTEIWLEHTKRGSTMPYAIYRSATINSRPKKT